MSRFVNSPLIQTYSFYTKNTFCNNNIVLKILHESASLRGRNCYTCALRCYKPAHMRLSPKLPSKPVAPGENMDRFAPPLGMSINMCTKTTKDGTAARPLSTTRTPPSTNGISAFKNHDSRSLVKVLSKNTRSWSSQVAIRSPQNEKNNTGKGAPLSASDSDTQNCHSGATRRQKYLQKNDKPEPKRCQVKVYNLRAI